MDCFYWWETETLDPCQKVMQEKLRRLRYDLDKHQNLTIRIQYLANVYQEAKSFVEMHKDEHKKWKPSISQLQNDIEVLRAEINALEGELEGLARKVVSEAQLLGVTLVRASYDRKLSEDAFDVLIVDEYSTASLPQLYCVACLVRERVILCGDHLQLPPICVSQSELAKKWLEQSFFDLHGAEKISQYWSVLKTQSRMPPAISKLVRPWYREFDNHLYDDWNEESNTIRDGSDHPLLSGHVTILDTTETNAYSSRSASKSYYNLVHAGVVGAVCKELIYDLKLEEGSIRCICPYRDQGALSRAVLRQVFGSKDNSLEYIAGTVHNNQGHESAVVIYDLTDGVQQRLSYFHKLDKVNFLNVALTRAKVHLVILCAYKKMRKALLDHPNAALRQVFKKLETDGVPVINAKQYADRVFKEIRIDDLLNDAVVELTEKQKQSILVLRSAEYYKALEYDLLECRESVLIVSPFVTRRRVETLKPLLQAVLARSEGRISVELITRSPEKMYNRSNTDPTKAASIRNVLDELSQLGVRVVVSPDTHGKLIVIDNKINYWGSLNSLSFRDTNEINTRLDAEGLSEKLIRLARSGRSWPYRASGDSFSEEDIRRDEQEIARVELRGLRGMISPLEKRPYQAILWRQTIEQLVTNPPKTWKEYFEIKELSRRNCVLRKYLDQIEDIIWPIRGWRLPKRWKGEDDRGTGDSPGLFS